MKRYPLRFFFVVLAFSSLVFGGGGHISSSKEAQLRTAIELEKLIFVCFRSFVFLLHASPFMNAGFGLFRRGSLLLRRIRIRRIGRIGRIGRIRRIGLIRIPNHKPALLVLGGHGNHVRESLELLGLDPGRVLVQVPDVGRGVRVRLEDRIVDRLKRQVLLLQEVTVLGTVKPVNRAEARNLGALELQEIYVLPGETLLLADWWHAIFAILLMDLPPRWVLLHLVDHLLRLQKLQGVDDEALDLHLVASQADLFHEVNGLDRRVAEIFLHVLQQDGGDALHDLLRVQVAVGHPLVELLLVALGLVLLPGVGGVGPGGLPLHQRRRCRRIGRRAQRGAREAHEAKRQRQEAHRETSCGQAVATHWPGDCHGFETNGKNQVWSQTYRTYQICILHMGEFVQRVCLLRLHKLLQQLGAFGLTCPV